MLRVTIKGVRAGVSALQLKLEGHLEMTNLVESIDRDWPAEAAHREKTTRRR